MATAFTRAHYDVDPAKSWSGAAIVMATAGHLLQAETSAAAAPCLTSAAADTTKHMTRQDMTLARLTDGCKATRQRATTARRVPCC